MFNIIPSPFLPFQNNNTQNKKVITLYQKHINTDSSCRTVTLLW